MPAPVLRRTLGWQPVMFRLVKWYCDVVSEEGAGAILYSARLSWGVLRLGYAAVRTFSPREPPREQASGRGVEPPRLAGDELVWRSGPLRANGWWHRDAPPLERRLVEGPAGMVHWHCHMPRARATLQVGDTRIDGLGYVECLRLGLPPWELGLRTLRWGRHLSREHWLVWILWEGIETRRWVWLDGLEQPTAAPGEGSLPGLAEGRRLVLGEGGSDLGERPVLATIRGPLPGLARRLAGPVGRMREHKRLAPSTILRSDRALDHGWTIHEVVEW